MITVVIPHAAPVRCLADTAEPTADGLTVHAVVAATSPGADAGVVRPGWLIEVAAQACAACAGAGAGGTARGGMVVGARGWQWHGPAPVDRDLLVHVARSASLGAMAEYRCTVHLGDRLVAAGSLAVMAR